MLPSTLNLFRQSSLCLALTAAGLMASVAVQANTVLGARGQQAWQARR